MSPDERRKAILDALIPLLLERGGDVTTKEIAQAAGIAEGTIFRVFPDKATLLFAAAEEAINLAAGRVLDRMRLTMAVMGAVRPYLAAKFHEAAHAKKKKMPMGPPEF